MGGGGGGQTILATLSNSTEFKMGLSDPTLCIKRRYPSKREIAVMRYFGLYEVQSCTPTSMFAPIKFQPAVRVHVGTLTCENPSSCKPAPAIVTLLKLLICTLNSAGVLSRCRKHEHWGWKFAPLTPFIKGASLSRKGVAIVSIEYKPIFHSV